MSPEISGPAELHDATSPTGDGWPDDRRTDERDGPRQARSDWPDDDAEDERDPAGPTTGPTAGTPPWRRSPAAYGRDGGPGGRSGLRPLALTIVAVVALGAGAGVALAITKGLDHSPSPSAAPSTQPSAVAPGGSSGGGTMAAARRRRRGRGDVRGWPGDGGQQHVDHDRRAESHGDGRDHELHPDNRQGDAASAGLKSATRSRPRSPRVTAASPRLPQSRIRRRHHPAAACRNRRRGIMDG